MPGEIGPFIWILCLVVKLLAAVRIMSVAPLFSADRVVVPEVRGDGRLLPRRLGILQQTANAFPLKMAGHGQTAKVHQGGINRHIIHAAVAAAVRFRYPGRHPNQRGASRLFPESELAPVMLLAQVPAMIAPKADDRIVALG